MEEKVIERLVYLIKIPEINGFLILILLLFNPLHKHLCPGLEKDYKVRRGNPPLKELEHLLIQPELFVIQVDPCENPVFVKKVVRNDSAFEQAFLIKFQGMLISPQQEKNLYLKGVSLGILIKFIEEGIVLSVFKQDLTVDPLGKFYCQACLAYTQRAFNDNMVMWIADVESPLCLRYFIEVSRNGPNQRLCI
jgi:hypothetical protein